MNDYQRHPVSSIFPDMDSASFDDLKGDIKANGQLEPIYLFEDKVLDGWHRWLACRAVGIDCKTREYHGRDPVGFVISLNLHRRHLNESQRAMTAARAANMQQGTRTDKPSRNSDEVSAAKAAQLMHVDRSQVFEAKKVISLGTQEVVKIVDTGKLAVSAAAKLVERTPEFQRRVVDKIEKGLAKSAVDAMRLVKHEDRLDVPTPKGKYRVVYADPPWDYGNVSLHQYGHSSYHYPAMSIEELCELPVRELATDYAVLFLWVTSPMLEISFRVIEAWGFYYKATFVWDKVKHNFGNYNSVRHEFLFVCTRGSGTPDKRKLYDSVQVIERSPKHSEKPEEFRKIIDDLYMQPVNAINDRIELFARRRPPSGWDAWGNELGRQTVEGFGQ
jgi:N6-adenosine-specific RNA methylase IME4